MSKKLVTLKNVESMKNVMKALRSGHRAFPVMNNVGNVVGVIPRNFIMTLLENRGFYMNYKE